MIRLTIFGQPCSKANSRQLVRFGKRPASIKSPEALAYEKSAIAQIPDSAKQMLEGRICMTLRIYYSSEQPDMDESIILDVLQAKYKRVPGKLERVSHGKFKPGKAAKVLMRKGVYINDRQVRERHVVHDIDKDCPRAEIIIEAKDPQQGKLFCDADQHAFDQVKKSWSDSYSIPQLVPDTAPKPF